VTVGPLGLPAPGHPLTGGVRSEAVQLFLARATAVTPGFSLGNGREEESAALCRALGGLPLAIEKAAALTSEVPLGELRKRIEADPLGLLTGGHTGGHPRHRSMLASIGWSHELCTPAERLLWARLSVFAELVSAEAAVYVCAGAHLHPAQLPGLLAGLTARSVLVRERGGHRLSPLYREYGLRWLRNLGEEDTLRRRHSHYVRTLQPGGWQNLGR
jgi:predicted ATPase